MSDQNDNALPPGCAFDGYRIARVLGTGGFGITYLAEEVETGRRVAIKEYLPKGTAQRRPGEAAIRMSGAAERAAFDLGLARIREEARTLIRFDHPNIVRSLRFVAAHGTAYLVMAYVEGESLESVLSRAGKLPESEVEEIAFPLLSGLAAVHRAGFLHRDVKPANIFLRRDNGAPVLLDFGAARQAFGQGAKTLTAIYSHGYAPFEQYSEAEGTQGPWTDIYALGATLYRCIAGNKPVAAPDRVMALVAGRPDPLPPAAQVGRDLYSAGLLAAIDAALRIREIDRPQSIEAFAAILRGPARRATPAPAAPVAAAVADETLMARSPAPSPPTATRIAPDPPVARPVAARPEAATAPCGWCAAGPGPRRCATCARPPAAPSTASGATTVPAFAWRARWNSLPAPFPVESAGILWLQSRASGPRRGGCRRRVAEGRCSDCSKPRPKAPSRIIANRPNRSACSRSP
jgi:serine/threonine protein kinase